MTHPLLLLLLFPAGTRAFNPRRTYSWGRSSVTVNFYDFHLPICLHASFSVVFRDIDFTEILMFFSQCIWNHLLHLSSTAQISTTIVITTHYIEEVCIITIPTYYLHDTTSGPLLYFRSKPEVSLCMSYPTDKQLFVYFFQGSSSWCRRYDAFREIGTYINTKIYIFFQKYFVILSIISYCFKKNYSWRKTARITFCKSMTNQISKAFSSIFVSATVPNEETLMIHLLSKYLLIHSTAI